MDCEWRIEATLGNKIYIEFSHFDLEKTYYFENSGTNCHFDYVEIIQYEEDRQVQSSKYCEESPKNFTSLHDVVVVK